MKRVIAAFAACVTALVMSLPAGAELPELSSSHVSMPWKDFKEIIKELTAERAEEPEDKVPAPFVINSAAYKGRLLESGSAEFEVRMELVVLEPEEWVKIPVIADGLAVESIKLDDKPVLSIIDGSWHRILLQGPGRHTLTARFYVEARNKRGPDSFSFLRPRTPVTTIEFTVDKPDQDIQAGPSAMGRLDHADDKSRVYAVLEPSTETRISWSRKVKTEKAELRLNAEVSSSVTLGERLCRVRSQIDYEILHRSVTGFKLSLPASAQVVDVSGKGIADWKSEKDGDGRTVEVALGYEASGNYTLQIDYELELPDSSADFELPELKTVETTRESGHIEVMAATNIEVLVKGVSGLVSVDASELPSHMKGGTSVIHAFKYLEHPWTLELETIRHRDIEVLTCTIDRALVTSFVSREGEFVTRAVYTIRNNREQFVRVGLPQNARLFSTFLEGAPVRPSRDKSGNILVPLEKSSGNTGKARSFQVEIIYMVKLAELDEQKGVLELVAPHTDLLTNLIQWKIYAPEDFRYEVEEATLEEKERGAQTIIGFDNFMRKVENELGDFEMTGNFEKSTQSTNIYQYKGKQAYTPVSLPVRFVLPESGAVLEFYKAVVQEGEQNSVTLSYDKPSMVWPKIRLALLATGAILLLVLLILVIGRAEKRGRARAQEVSK